VFGIQEGMFLGFIVNQRGIKANADKITALIEMQSPTYKKGMQKLTERVATLNRFISRATDKCLLLFKVLRKTFEWNDECEKSFQELKKYFGSTYTLLYQNQLSAWPSSDWRIKFKN